MSKYQISKEFFPYSRFTPPFRNANVVGFIGSLLKAPKRIWKDKEINILKEKIISYDGNSIDVLIISPKNEENNLPCLVYFHGGGFFLGAAPYHYQLAKKYALNANCKVIFVQYRLTPKNPDPAPLEDCFYALKWTFENANTLNIDSTKIAVGGDSAGGCLAASVCQLARDRNLNPILFQLLIYPVIDSQMDTESNRKYNDTPMWNSRLSKIMWDAYLKKSNLEVNYASPIYTKSFKNLPDAYIETAEFDCLHDEAIIYANALVNNDVAVEINETKQTMHGFDIVQKSSITINAVNKRIEYMKKQFLK